MARITKISVQQRNKSRYNLFLDRGNGEEYAFSIDEDVLIKHRLKKGLDLQEEELLKLIDEDERKKTYHLALHYLSYRMRSMAEVRVYLTTKGRNEHHIDAVINQLALEKWLNDYEFAVAYVLTKKRTTLKGPHLIKQELKEKGVHSSLIEDALEQFSLDEQIEKLIQWLQKQAKKQPNLSLKAYVEKLGKQLINKGFSHDVVTEAMKEVEFSLNEDEEWTAICYHGEKIVRKYAGRYNGWEFNQKVKQALYRKGFSFELIERFLDERDEAK